MQIAKMFASLGFKVDTTGLNKFKSSLSAARGEMTNISRGTKTATRQLRGFKREVNNVAKALDKIKGAGAASSSGKAYDNIASSAKRLNTALNQIATNRRSYTKAIGKINSSVAAGAPIWERYRESVVRTRQALRNINGDLTRLRNNSRVDIRVNRRDTTTRTGGSGGGFGGGGALGGFGAGAFVRNFLPAASMMGVAGGAGFAVKGAVDASRNQTKMESMILMTSKSSEEFASTLSYVREEANRLGLSSVELGKSFAQINMSARDMNNEDKKEMFTGFSEFMMSMGTSADDQKGIFRAFNQMFSNNRILQEEINQLSDRGIPATLIYDAAMKSYGTDDIKVIKKLQEDGKLDPERVLLTMSRMVKELARESGAYDKMMQSSIVKQGQMMNKLSEVSKQIMDSGLDVFLGKIFGLLTDIADHVGKASVAVSAFVKKMSDIGKWLYDVTGDFRLWAASLLLVLFRFQAMTVSLRTVFRLIGRQAGAIRVLAALFTGLFGRALGSVILRFGGWATAIYIVIKALSFLGDQIRRGNEGQWTFFDWMFHQFDVAILKIKIFWAYFEIYKNYITGGKWVRDIGNSATSWFDEYLEKARNFKKEFHERNGTSPIFTGRSTQTIESINKYTNPSQDIQDYQASNFATSKQVTFNGMLITKNSRGGIVSSDEFSTTATVAGLA